MEQQPGEHPDRERIIAALAVGQRDAAWLDTHPSALEPYRGEWVVVYQQRVVAHAADGRMLARDVNARCYPGSTVLYVPTREEAGAVHVL